MTTYHEQIREARLAANLSYLELQKRTGVPRQQIKILEEGGNVTIKTLQKIVDALPNLPPLHIGTATMTTDHSDLAELVATARATLASVQYLVTTLEAKMQSAARGRYSAVAPGTVDPELVRRLTEEEVRLRKQDQERAEEVRPRKRRMSN